MVREGQVVAADTLSELGIFGYLVRRGDKVLHNKGAGHMMRTKVICTPALNVVTASVTGLKQIIMSACLLVCMKANLHVNVAFMIAFLGIYIYLSIVLLLYRQHTRYDHAQLTWC